jgi:hypothetical protein
LVVRSESPKPTGTVRYEVERPDAASGEDEIVGAELWRCTDPHIGGEEPRAGDFLVDECPAQLHFAALYLM